MDRRSAWGSAYGSMMVGLFFLIGSGVASAADGVLEINQACATTTGCFAGDAPGFPVTIDGGSGRSYRFTSDLVVPDENTTGIEISKGDITVDLNGFSLSGPTVCTGMPVTACAPTGIGDGIVVPALAGTLENLEVRNGTVRGLGRFGVSLRAQGARVVNVRAMHNGLTGIGVNSNPSVRGGSVRDCTSITNGLDGIYLGSDGFAQGNVAMGNGRWGIDAIERSVVLDNELTRNANEGLSTSAFTGYARNVISENNGGNLNPQVGGTGYEIGQNVCGTNTTCP